MLEKWQRFGVIGSGGRIAEAFLHQYDWDVDISIEECLYRVFSAKVAAEKNPHVGPTTSLEILLGRKRFDVTDETFEYLKKLVKPRAPKLKFPKSFLEELPDEEDGTIKS